MSRYIRVKNHLHKQSEKSSFASKREVLELATLWYAIFHSEVEKSAIQLTSAGDSYQFIELSQWKNIFQSRFAFSQLKIS